MSRKHRRNKHRESVNTVSANREAEPKPTHDAPPPQVTAKTIPAKTAIPAALPPAKNPVAQMTRDGYDNFLSRIGLNNDNALSDGGYEFNLVTRNRILLEAAYRGSWIVGQVVDCVAEDMTRAGIDMTTVEGDDDIKKMKTQMVRLQIWQSLREGIQWGRLYGGGLGIMQIEGQDMSTPLDIRTVQKGQFKGIVVYDRWMLNPLMTPVIQSGPDMGLPMYYQIVNNLNSMEPIANTNTGTITVHHSRCIRFMGIKLPWFQAITEMMWGESNLERLWDRLIAFDNATMSSASLIDRANLRTVGIENLRNIIAAGGEAFEGLLKFFEMMRLKQVNEGLTLLDKEDTFAATAYSFAGLSDMLLQFGQQLAGASNIPLIRLFGQLPSGLGGGSGDADIRMYYDSILAQQEARLRIGVDKITRVLWRSTFGTARPADFEFTFVPLWQMSATDKANVAKTNTETILGAHEGGLVPTGAAMRELREASGDTGLFNNITDEDIEEAEAADLLTPMPDAEVGGEGGDTGKIGTQVKSLTSKVPSFGAAAAGTSDSTWQRIKHWFDSTPKAQRDYRAWRPSDKFFTVGGKRVPFKSDPDKWEVPKSPAALPKKIAEAATAALVMVMLSLPR